MIPIWGDISIDELGLDPAVRQTLVDELDIILNSAASISFDDPLKDALRINYMGTRRILDLANSCKRLLALHHLSTCGVHTHLPSGGDFPEELVPFPGIGDQDWEEWVNDLLAKGPEYIDKE